MTLPELEPGGIPPALHQRRYGAEVPGQRQSRRGQVAPLAISCHASRWLTSRRWSQITVARPGLAASADDPSLGLGPAPIGDKAQGAMAAVHALEPWLTGLPAHVGLIDVHADDPVAPAPITAQKDVLPTPLGHVFEDDISVPVFPVRLNLPPVLTQARQVRTGCPGPVRGSLPGPRSRAGPRSPGRRIPGR